MLKVLSHGGAGLKTILAPQDLRLSDDDVWLDLLEPTREEELAVERCLGIELPTREEMAEIEPSSRLYQEAGATVLIATVLTASDTARPISSPVTFVLARRRLITIRYVRPRAFEVFAAQAERQPENTASGAQVLVGLLDAIVDRLADVLERTSAQVERTSLDVFARPRTAPFEDIIDTLGRAQVVDSKVRDSLVSLHRMISFAGLNDEIEANHECRDHLASLHRDVQSLTDHCSYQSGNITFLLDAAMGLINIEQNSILKRFSIFSIAFIPPTLVAGIYGMNFQHMPELAWQWGYFGALVLMIIASMGPLLFFRRRGWL